MTLPGAVDALIAFAQAEATALLEANRDVLEAVVDALCAKGKIGGDELDEIIADVVTRSQIAAEHRRRADWKQRIEGARQFEEMVESSK